jgi:cbb3-type cytochrome oxidase maturation protein
MSVIVVLIGFSMLVAGGFLLAFMWAVRTGQFDDRYTPSVRMLFDGRSRRSADPLAKTQHTIDATTVEDSHTPSRKEHDGH